MSAYSTINITRSAAKDAIFNMIWNVSDSQLETFMDEILRDRLYNVRIVPDDHENQDELLEQ